MELKRTSEQKTFLLNASASQTHTQHKLKRLQLSLFDILCIQNSATKLSIEFELLLRHKTGWTKTTGGNTRKTPPNKNCIYTCI